MRRFIVSLLFKLLGEPSSLFEVSHLFGRSVEEEKRKRMWEKGLADAWRNEGLKDFLFYEAETDKERVFRGVSNPDMARGARARTLFLVEQMRLAHLSRKGRHLEEADAKREVQKEKVETKKWYQHIIHF